MDVAPHTQSPEFYSQHRRSHSEWCMPVIPALRKQGGESIASLLSGLASQWV